MPIGTDDPRPSRDTLVPAGRALGRYELLTEIASGGMASVFLARARAVAGFERVVAVKVCHPHLRGDEEFATMFLDEARLAARIHHPNVVSTLDVGDDGARLYLVMEYIEGDRLSGLIKAASRRGECIASATVSRIFLDALAGLHAAHELVDGDGAPLGIVHRDVSPQNILVGIDGVARITDFGIAKAESSLSDTGVKKIKGKLSYMAPEQIEGAPLTRRTDLYAAGVVLWESLTGRRLFRGESDQDTARKVLANVVPRPSKIAAGIDPAYDAVVLKATARDPAARFATAEEFIDALEALPGKLSNARAVASAVQDLLGPALLARRDLVKRIGEGDALGPVELTNPAGLQFGHTDVSVSVVAALPPPLPRSSVPPPLPSTDPLRPSDPPATERRRPVVVYAAVSLAVLAVLFVVWAARSPSRASVRPAAARAPITNVSPPPPVAPAPPPPVVAPAAATNPDPVPVAVEAPSVEAAVPSTRGRSGPSPRRPALRGPVRTTPGEAPPPPPPPPAGEFRPGSI